MEAVGDTMPVGMPVPEKVVEEADAGVETDSVWGGHS